jgi:hypothetical protein
LSFRLPRDLGSFLSWGTTFLLIAVGFIFFRANDLTQAWAMLRTIVTPSAYGHFAMPHSFYMLMFTVVVGYFGITAGHALLRSWRARYREAISKRGESATGTWPVPVTNVTLAIGGVVDFFTGKLWWWFAPALSIVAVFAGVAIYTREAVIAVTPFIYTLF